MSLVHNERTKLTATWFNTLATALVATGGIAPVAAWLYGIADLKIEKLWAVSLASICVTLGAILHMIGRRFLGRLRA